MKLGKTPKFRVLVIAVSLLVGLGPAGAAEIAGLHPYQRPDDPVITTYPKDGEWYRHALRGVKQPYPASLRFLEDQGAWFTPFTHPGMTGPYDIRHLHQAQSQ